MITAKWGSKEFEASLKKILTPDGISISESLNIEEVEVAGKKPRINIKGIDLQKISFEIKLDSRFVHVETEYNWWRSKLLSKTTAALILGDLSLGNMLLTSISIDELLIGNKGLWQKAKLSVEFTENDADSLNKSIESNKKVSEIKASKNTYLSSNIIVGSFVRPKSGKRWYNTALEATYKRGVSSTALTNVYHIINIEGDAYQLSYGLWMRKEDLTLV